MANNIGVGQQYFGSGARIKLYSDWLQAASAEDSVSGLDPDQHLVILSDAADVLFGGCVGTHVTSI